MYNGTRGRVNSTVRRSKNMNRVLPLITLLLLSLPVSAKEITLSADKNEANQIIFQETIPTGVLDGIVTLTKQHGYLTNPTRVVIGLFDETPKKHAFQAVLEQIEESNDKYWLAYEYVKDGKVIIRIDLESEITLNQEVAFNFMWFESDRIQILINNISHQPYVSLKSKTPFISIHSGSARLNYTFNKTNWTNGTPPISVNNAPVN